MKLHSVTILKTAAVLAAIALVMAFGVTKAAKARTQAAAAATPAAAEPPVDFELAPVEPGTAPPNPYSTRQIERGRHLVMAGSCVDCHTPWVYNEKVGMPAPDPTRMMSGHPRGAPDPASQIAGADMAIIGPTFTSFRFPFGVTYSANLTPDLDSGTGSWTEQMFLDIFRKGRHLGGDGRSVLPPMPAFWFSYMSDEDLVSIFAYLRSLPPIHNVVPSPAVPEEAIWQIRDIQDRMDAELRAALPATATDRRADRG